MIWKRFRRRRKPEHSPDAAPSPAPDAAPAPATPASTPLVSPDDLANPAIERLAEDEALRGDLTDDGYQPLQSWAFAALTRLAGEAAREADSQAAMDRDTAAVRAVVQSAVQAATDKALGDLPEQIRAVVPETDRSAITEALHHITFTDDTDANAQAIAGALTGQDAK